jgi:CRP/FNR family transcriptional regulator, cyclic AMP receptor protein
MPNGMQCQKSKLYQFKIKIHALARQESRRNRMIKVSPGAVVYVSGDRDAMVYSVESGRIKQVLNTPEGREYVLAIRSTGDIFGELCLSGELTRSETAIAMHDTQLHAIPYEDLLKLLKAECLLEDLIWYLACCNAAQQETIGSLLTENSERRLARLLLQLGSPLSGNNSHGKVAVPRMLHEDLAAMIGTTRSRIGFFLSRFKEQGILEVNADRSLTIEAEKLDQFVQQNAFIEDAMAGNDRNDQERSLRSYANRSLRGIESGQSKGSFGGKLCTES